MKQDKTIRDNNNNQDEIKKKLALNPLPPSFQFKSEKFRPSKKPKIIKGKFIRVIL